MLAEWRESLSSPSCPTVSITGTCSATWSTIKLQLDHLEDLPSRIAQATATSTRAASERDRAGVWV